MITDKIEVSDNILASGGFSDVRTGTYLGALVAVKTMRVEEQDYFMKKISKVSIYAVSSTTWTGFRQSFPSNSAKKSCYGMPCPTRTS